MTGGQSDLLFETNTIQNADGNKSDSSKPTSSKQDKKTKLVKLSKQEEEENLNYLKKMKEETGVNPLWLEK